jgi:hypothetical protein
MGRLYVKLEAENTLGQVLLPLLADLLTSSSSSSTPSTRSGTGALAGLASTLSTGGAPSPAVENAQSGARAAAAGGQATAAEVAGAVVCALEGMASVCVQRGRDQWLYEQVLQLLMRMYREPSQVGWLTVTPWQLCRLYHRLHELSIHAACNAASCFQAGELAPDLLVSTGGSQKPINLSTSDATFAFPAFLHLQLTLQLLAGKSAAPSTAGVLADTLHLLAAGLEQAPQHTRKDLSLKLLLLFSEVAAAVGGSSGVVRADLGDLLVAVAVAAEGLEHTIRLLGGGSSGSSLNRMSIGDIQVCCQQADHTVRGMEAYLVTQHAFVLLRERLDQHMRHSSCILVRLC